MKSKTIIEKILTTAILILLLIFVLRNSGSSIDTIYSIGDMLQRPFTIRVPKDTSEKISFTVSPGNSRTIQTNGRYVRHSFHDQYTIVIFHYGESEKIVEKVWSSDEMDHYSRSEMKRVTHVTYARPRFAPWSSSKGRRNFGSGYDITLE